MFYSNYETDLKLNPHNVIEAVNRQITKRLLKIRKSDAVSLTHVNTGEEKLTNIAEAQGVLIQANTVFPFVLFPSTVCLDRQKLTIVHRVFFRTANTISMQIDDILNVDSSVGFLFGSLHLYSKYFVNDVKTIDYLKRSDIIKIQRLIQGYSIARRRKIDCTAIEKNQLIALLNSLGDATAN